MSNEEVQREVIKALWDAGLCICERNIIPSIHPGLVDQLDYIMERLEESEGR